MSNYPPGVSAGTPRAPWNEPDRSHHHEFLDGEMVIEDGAAIFYEKCAYHERGWECDETRTTRCDIDRVIKRRSDQPDVTYLESEWTEEIDHVCQLFEDVLQLLVHPADNFSVVSATPLGMGPSEVVIENDDYRVVFSE